VRRGDTVSFPGILRPDELVERTGIRVPENGDYETVAGFVMSELGRLPAVGDEVLIDEGTLVVQRLDGRRIDRVRFVPNPSPLGSERSGETR
jgi:CBS domain containing-hemolysin-like protein